MKRIFFFSKIFFLCNFFSGLKFKQKNILYYRYGYFLYFLLKLKIKQNINKHCQNNFYSKIKKKIFYKKNYLDISLQNFFLEITLTLFVIKIYLFFFYKKIVFLQLNMFR